MKIFGFIDRYVSTGKGKDELKDAINAAAQKKKKKRKSVNSYAHFTKNRSNQTEHAAMLKRYAHGKYADEAWREAAAQAHERAQAEHKRAGQVLKWVSKAFKVLLLPVGIGALVYFWNKGAQATPSSGDK